MITEHESVSAVKKPRKCTVTVVVGPLTLEEIRLLIGSMERRNPMALPNSVSDVVGAAVNVGLSQMGWGMLGEGASAPAQAHDDSHGPSLPCRLGCAGYRSNHYA